MYKINGMDKLAYKKHKKQLSIILRGIADNLDKEEYSDFYYRYSQIVEPCDVTMDIMRITGNELVVTLNTGKPSWKTKKPSKAVGAK